MVKSKHPLQIYPGTPWVDYSAKFVRDMGKQVVTTKAERA